MQEKSRQHSTSASELDLIDQYWRAANYLSVGQIYLLGNPLLREPLRVQHIKPRLLGHWDTTPGLNLIYAHLTRIIRARELSMIYVCGPGHGGPDMVANTYLEGTYSEIYSDITATATGSQNCFASFPFPEEFQAMPRPRLRARSTKAVNSAMRWSTPMARRSTIPTR